MQNKEQLEKIVGKRNVSDAKEALARYSRDHSLVPPAMPDLVVRPKDAEEVGAVVKWANEHDIPLVPVSSEVHFYGCTIPKQGGVVVDLTRMNKIFEIDDYNRRVRIEPGVTWKQLTEELEKKGMRMIMPLSPPANRSVLTDYLEREVPTNTVYDYGEPTQSFELVWPTGEVFRLGSASVNGYPESKSKGANPSGPGLDFYRFLQGAQGTMGIVTWMNLKSEFATKIDKIYCAPVDDLAYVQDFLYRLLPRRIGQEVVLLNNVDLAAILAENWPDDFEKLRVYTAAVVAHHGHQRPCAEAGREGGVRREVPERGSHQERVPENQAHRQSSRFPRRGAQALVAAAQTVARGENLLEERMERRRPEPVLYCEAGFYAALCRHSGGGCGEIRAIPWPISACISSP